MTTWSFFSDHRDEIIGATLDHLALVVIAMLIAILIGVPLGMFIVQRPALRTIALGIASIFQTIPSLALFGFLIPIPFIGGIGKRTAIVALVLYALLPILRNTYVGLTGIDPAVLEAAEAMGMTRAQILFRVRFPLALAVILAGIRTATIITIGVATIAAAIGAGGLGTFIFRGVALVSDALILAGAIPAALLALLADFLLGLLERRLKCAALYSLWSFSLLYLLRPAIPRANLKLRLAPSFSPSKSFLPSCSLSTSKPKPASPSFEKPTWAAACSSTKRFSPASSISTSSTRAPL
jgi:osmoprotectant transport system permease protein